MNGSLEEKGMAVYSARLQIIKVRIMVAPGDDDHPIPLERWAAVLKYRGLDSEAMVVAQKRNLKSLLDASQVVAKGLEDLASRNAGLLRQHIERASDVLPNLSKTRTLDEVAREQLDFSKDTLETAINGYQELTDLLWKCNRQAVDMISRSMLDGLQAMARSNPFVDQAALGTDKPEAASPRPKSDRHNR